jgi:hypothetical protein
LPLAVGCLEPKQQSAEWESLGLPASAEVWTQTEGVGAELLAEFPQAMERVAASMSLDRPDSELNRINREAAEGWYKVTDRDLYRAVVLGVDYAKASGGTYDPTAGSENPNWQAIALERGIFTLRFTEPGLRVDLDGIREGYAVDVAARKFVRTGSLAGLIRLGHHLYAWGDPPGREPWWVEVTDPRRAEPQPLVGLRVDFSRGVGLAAGGEGPDAPFALAIADSTADAIVVSRALLAGGATRAGLMLAERVRRVEAVMLVESGGERQLLVSATLEGKLELRGDLARYEPRFLLPPEEIVGRLD